MTVAGPTLSLARTGLKPKGEVCDLDHSLAKRRDPLASFLIAFICATGMALACMIQFTYAPSMWTHLLIALPPVLLICLLSLRPLKAGLYAIGSASRYRK